MDAEREYGTLARAFGGEVVEISPHSAHHLNPLEVVFGFNDENLIAQKSGLITSILEQQMANGAIKGSYNIGASIIPDKIWYIVEMHEIILYNLTSTQSRMESVKDMSKKSCAIIAEPPMCFRWGYDEEHEYCYTFKLLLLANCAVASNH